MQLPLLTHVVEHHHGTDDFAVTVLDRRGRVLNRDRRSISRIEHDVVRKRYDTAFLETARHGILDGFTRHFVSQHDDRLDRRALHLAATPNP